MATDKTVARTDETEVREGRTTEEGQPKQRVDRTSFDLSNGADVGPKFPSGMSAPEAALSGATAGMDDTALAKIEELRTGKKADVETDDGEAV